MDSKGYPLRQYVRQDAQQSEQDMDYYADAQSTEDMRFNV